MCTDLPALKQNVAVNDGLCSENCHCDNEITELTFNGFYSTKAIYFWISLFLLKLFNVYSAYTVDCIFSFSYTGADETEGEDREIITVCVERPILITQYLANAAGSELYGLLIPIS